MSFITNLFESNYEKEIEVLISPERNLQGTINTEHLEQADSLKSGKTNPKVFVSTLVKVIKRTTNGNIIINILSLLDTCIKNAGQGFYLELNTITLIEQFQRILREFDVNVRNKTKECIQNWVFRLSNYRYAASSNYEALLFKNNTEMFMFTDLYENLKRMGVDFPSVTIPISSALVETKLVHLLFNVDCSSKNIPLPALGLTDPVRVCDTCHYKITTGNASSVVANSPIAVGGNVINTNNNNAEDDDLQRAIEASLRLSTGGGYQNQRSGFNEKSVKFAEPKAKSSDDDELERAIKESLLEAERVKTKPNVTNFSNKEPSPYESARFSSNPEQPSYNRQSSHTEPPTLLTSKPSYDLTPTQLSNISLFATLVQTQSHEIAAKGYENFNPHQLQTLFAQVASLHSQLTSCVQEAAEGYKELYEMNELLNEVIGVYETYNQQKMLYNGKGQFAYAPQGNSTGYTQQSGYSGGYASQGNPTGAYASPPNTTGYPPQQIAQGYTQEPIRQQDYNPQVPVQAMPYAPHQSSNALQEFISQMPLQGQPYPVQQNTPPHGYAPQAQTQGSPFSPPSQSFPNQHYPQGVTGPSSVQQHYSPQSVPGQPQSYQPGQIQHYGQPSQPPGFGANQVLVPKVVPEAPQDAPLIDL